MLERMRRAPVIELSLATVFSSHYRAEAATSFYWKIVTGRKGIIPLEQDFMKIFNPSSREGNRVLKIVSSKMER